MIKSEVQAVKDALNKATQALFVVTSQLSSKDYSTAACYMRKAHFDAIAAKDSVNKALASFK